MLTPLTVSAYLLPPPAAFPRGVLTDGHRPRSDPLGRLAVFAASVAKGRAALKEQSDRFEELYREAEQTNAPAEELEEAAAIIFDNERKVAAVLVPQIEQIEQKLARKHPPTDFARSVRRSAEEALDIGQTWLELYQRLRIRLLKLASDRRGAAGGTGNPILSDTDEMEWYLRRIAGG